MNAVSSPLPSRLCQVTSLLGWKEDGVGCALAGGDSGILPEHACIPF